MSGSESRTADGHVVEGVAGLGSASDPLANDIVAFRDQISRAAEGQVRERGPEFRGERPNLVAAAAWRAVQAYCGAGRIRCFPF